MVRRDVLASVCVGVVAFATSTVLGSSLIEAAVVSLVSVLNTFLVLSLKIFTVGLGRLKKRVHQKRSFTPVQSKAKKTVTAKDASRDWSMNILLVDDDPAVLEHVAQMAAKKGFHNVTPVQSKETALSLLAETDKAFDCVLLDMSMPQADAIEVCYRIREINGYRDTPIIMLCDKDNLGTIDDAFAAGATDYAMKPVTAKEIGKRLGIAQALYLAGHAQNRLVREYDRYLEMQTPDIGFDLVRDGQLCGAKTLVQQSVFSNFLTQLPSRLQSAVHVYALTLPDLKVIQSQAQQDEFLELLEDVSGAAERCFWSSLILMTYDPHGSLLVIVDSSFRSSAQHIENEIKRQLEAMGRVYAGQDASTLRLGVGAPILPKGAKEQRARMTIDRALLLAVNRNAENNSKAMTGFFRHRMEAALQMFGAFHATFGVFKASRSAVDRKDVSTS